MSFVCPLCDCFTFDCSFVLENCFLDEGYSGVFKHEMQSPYITGGNEKLQPSQVQYVVYI